MRRMPRVRAIQGATKSRGYGIGSTLPVSLSAIMALLRTNKSRHRRRSFVFFFFFNCYKCIRTPTVSSADRVADNKLYELRDTLGALEERDKNAAHTRK